MTRFRRTPPPPAAESYILRFAWPHPALSPNARVSRQATAHARSTAKKEAQREAGRIQAAVTPDAHIEVTFHAPDNRRRGMDNLFASLNAHLSGIADAAGIDGRDWSFTLRKGVAVAGGCVVIKIMNPSERRP
jgi:hypothetical protein